MFEFWFVLFFCLSIYLYIVGPSTRLAWSRGFAFPGHVLQKFEHGHERSLAEGKTYGNTIRFEKLV